MAVSRPHPASARMILRKRLWGSFLRKDAQAVMKLI
jgi:hypothetical protein